MIIHKQVFIKMITSNRVLYAILEEQYGSPFINNQNTLNSVATYNFYDFNLQSVQFYCDTDNMCFKSYKRIGSQ